MKSARRLSALVALAALTCSTANLRAVNWFVGNGTTNQSIFSTYGQYYEAGGGLHFHEGVDIAVADNTQVKSPVAATISAMYSDATPSNGIIVLNTGAGTDGYNVVHIVAGNRPAKNNGPLDPGGPWAVGDTVKIGDLLGTCPPQATYPTHLHIDVGTGVDPYGFSIHRPSDNYLAIVSPNTSNNDPKPVVNDNFQYRIAAHDRNGTFSAGTQLQTETIRQDNQYFQGKEGGIKVVGARPSTVAADGSTGTGSANFDMVVSAYDQGAIATKYRNGVYRLDFQATGKAFGDTTTKVTPFFFRDRIIDNGGNQGYADLRNGNYVRTVYSNDATCDSKDLIDADAANRGTYWYTITNADDDLFVQLSDRNRYWHSNVVKGKKWNDITAADAASNAKAQFRDDIYDVAVTAWDAGLQTTTNTQKIILDNFEQTLAVDKPTYETGEVISITGAQYSPSDNVQYYLFDHTPSEGEALSSALGTASTDLNGLLSGYIYGGLPNGQYWIASDYNHDNLFLPSLDAFSTFVVVPEPAALAPAVILLSTLARRRR